MNFFLLIPSSRSGSGESLGKWLLLFHNNYLWALMVSGFGLSSFSPTLGRSSECLPVAKRIINATYHVVSVWSWQTFQAWPGLVVLAVLSASTWALALSFLLHDFPRFKESPWMCEISYLQEYSMKILSNWNLFKILSLGIICLNASSLRNGGFNHWENICRQGITAFVKYSTGSTFNVGK